jgi:outer membrane receptor protein involved in Fe transport
MHFGPRATFMSSAALFAFVSAVPASAQTDQSQAPTAQSQAPTAQSQAQTEAQVQNKQQTPQQDQALGNENSQEIVVTAQKRAQVLLDVPSSVTVVGGDTLEKQQAKSFQDYLSLVPGFSINGSTAGVTRITLRGANTGGVASTVAIFMDDVPFGSSTGLANGSILSGDFDPFDLNRIEVLRGPQGTLYGASSFGGVLRYITNAPKLNQFEVRGQAGIEDTDHGGLGYNAAAVLNVPLGDKAAVRVDGFYRNDHGYIDSIGNNPILSLLTGQEIGRTLVAHDINDRKSFGGRASVLFNPTDNLSIRLTAFGQNLNSGAADYFEANPRTLKPLYGGYVQSRYQPEPTDIKYRVYYGTVDWDIGFANLFSETSYSTFKENLETDATFVQGLGQLVNLLANLGPNVGLIGLPPNFIITPVPVFRPLGVELFQTTGTKKFTQELRLASPNNDTLEWLVGGFYTHENSAIDPQDYFATEFGTDTIATDISQIAHIFLHSKYDEYAAFGNATWHITPRADLTVGGRLAHNKQSANLLIDSDLLGSAAGNNLNSSETVFTYSVAPRYELSKHASIYARVASGYRPGGPNVIPAGSPPGVPATYGADRLTNWEVGIKAEAPDAHLWSIELAAYHINWKDIQLFERINNTGINANGGEARVNGLEFSGALRPVAGVTFSANGAYTNAKLKDDTPPDTGGFAGDPLPWVPRWSGAMHADYDFPLGAGTSGFVGGTVEYVGERHAEFNERNPDGSLILIPGYAQVDLRAGLNVGRFTIEAFAHNLFDKGGITDAFGFPDPVAGDSFPNGAAGVAVIRPRTIGLTLTANISH